eukprot:3175132-Karenia_brevis.AAC.1
MQGVEPDNAENVEQHVTPENADQSMAQVAEEADTAAEMAVEQDWLTVEDDVKMVARRLADQLGDEEVYHLHFKRM